MDCSGLLNLSDSEEENTCAENDPSQFKLGTSLTKSQVCAFLEYCNKSEFDLGLLKKFREFCNKHHKHITEDWSLLKLYFSALKLLRSNLENVLKKCRNSENILVEIFGEVNYRARTASHKSSAASLRKIWQELELQSAISELEGIIEAKQQTKPRFGKKNQKKQIKRINSQMSRISLEDTNLPFKRESSVPNPKPSQKAIKVEQEVNQLAFNLESTYLDSRDLETYFPELKHLSFESITLYNPAMKLALEPAVLETPRVITPKYSEWPVKFNLVLDLDNTLIQAVESSKDQEITRPGLNKTSITIENQRYVIYLRYGLYEFLEKVNEFCNIYVYTNGIKVYAYNILQAIDPQRRYFRGYKARENDSEILKDLKLLEMELQTPLDRRLTLIIDDQLKVWKTSQDYPLVIPSLMFEPSNNLLTGMKVLKNSDIEFKYLQSYFEESKNSQLVCLAKALERTYKSFLKNKGVFSAVEELEDLKSKVLEGVKVSFSKFEEILKEDPHAGESKLKICRLMAKELGAVEEETGVQIVRNPEPYEKSFLWIQTAYFYLSKLGV